MRSPGVAVQLLLLAFIASAVPVSVSPQRGTDLNISSSPVKGCRVCTGAGRSRQCEPSLVIKGGTRVSMEFECSRPQDVFTVEIVRNIECTTKSCSGHIIQADSDSLSFLDFNRKFTWNLKASPPKAFKIDFHDVGLRQINPSESCPAGHRYTLQAFQATGGVAVGKYCTVGPVRSAQILNEGSFSLDVPPGQKLQNGQFDVSVGEEIKSLAKITLTLPKGTSSSELLSPNYPDSFPDDDLMEWYVQVPDGHTAGIRFLNLSEPRCLKKEAAMEYHGNLRAAVLLSLTEQQPGHLRGTFTLVLRNCEMDTRQAGSRGLSLHFKVFASSARASVPCEVDVNNMEGLSLHIERLRPASACEMSVDAVSKEKIAITGTSHLTFQDCAPEDLHITAMRVIACNQLEDCPTRPARLSVPALPTCLPAPLSSVTWTLRPPLKGSVELVSPAGLLTRSPPGQQCDDGFIRVAEDDGTTIGNFCRRGAIREIQLHSNVSVTVSGVGAKGPRTPPGHVLDAIFKGAIKESYIFTVSPETDTPVLLATPGWPAGMKSYSTVSWIVSVPPKMDAHLMFDNLSQPKCRERHTNIRVRRIGRLEEEYSRREDEEPESELAVSGSFYLNMSNCMPEKGHFGVLTKVTLQKSQNLLITIVSVVASLVVVFVIVLVVVCVLIRKKRKKELNQVSIYNPNGTSFLPGLNGFPKTREDNESHEYASIEETLIYTDLLKKGAEMGVYGGVDTYRSFAGHTDSQKPLVGNDADTEDMPVGAYQQFRAPPLPVRPPSHGQGLVDNVIYQPGGEGENSPNVEGGK